MYMFIADHMTYSQPDTLKVIRRQIKSHNNWLMHTFTKISKLYGSGVTTLSSYTEPGPDFSASCAQLRSIIIWSLAVS